MRLFLLVLTAMLAVAGIPAQAGTLADARIGFSADRTLVFDGRIYRGRMWTMPGKERHEQVINGFDPVFILRTDTPIGEVVLGQLHTAVEFVFPPELRLLGDKRLTRHPVGQETIGGIATTEYAVDETVPEGHAQGTLWLSRDGIPMRLAGKFTARNGHTATVRWELSHVRIGPQPEALFEVPADFKRLPAEAVAPLLGLRLKGPHG
jgi:hypothetical protein